MLNKQTIEKMVSMHISEMSNCCTRILESPDSQSLTTEEIIGLSVDAEWQVRQNRKLKRLLRKASLADNGCLEDIDYDQDRKLDKSTILRLGECSYIQEQNHVLITGKTGCGKTFLVCALGNMACRRNYTVQYIRVPKLIIDMNIAKQEGTYNKLLSTLRKTNLLILDDWGIAPFSEASGRDILEIVEERTRIGSMLISSQLPVNSWYELFADPTIADACLDRILHKSYRIDIKGGSMRRKNSTINDKE